MKDILIYGDSNTWGYNPDTYERYEGDIRYPLQLSKLLG